MSLRISRGAFIHVLKKCRPTAELNRVAEAQVIDARNIDAR
jgi:hypothetical protein